MLYLIFTATVGLFSIYCHAIDVTFAGQNPMLLGKNQGRRKESRARGADGSKKAPTTLGQQIYPRNGGHPRHFLGNIIGYASHSHINDCLSNQVLLAFSVYDLCCIILTIGKHCI